MGDALGEIHAFTERRRSAPSRSMTYLILRIVLINFCEKGLESAGRKGVTLRGGFLLLWIGGAPRQGRTTFPGWRGSQFMLARSKRREYAAAGLAIDPEHVHCRNFLERPSRGI
jgi:hypothetical protein